MENAQRLLADSLVLAKQGRFRSAVLLAILALEEFGKELVANWGVRNEANRREFPSHIEKQSALFALLSAAEILDLGREEFERRGANFLELGPHSHQFAWARAGFYEQLRMAVTYDDAEPLMPADIVDQIDRELVDDLHEYFANAVVVANNENAMNLAAEIYRNGLGRL